MLRMPVATLRVWERRYGLTQPALSPGGQRLYSADDVRRLALIRQLADLGHAIGSLAPMDMPQLQRVAATHAHALTTTQQNERSAAPSASLARTWRLAVIGAALATRLRRPALLRRLGRALQLMGPFDDAAQAAAALQGSTVDALLIHEAHLHPGWLTAFDAAAPALAGLPKAVLYGFAADAVCEDLAAAGTAVLREPQPDVVVAQWLRSVCLAAEAPGPAEHPFAPSAEAAPPRRWDDVALAEFAGRSSQVACECPRHVAELLLQLSHFESYSATCEHRSTADAGLHAHLQQVAAAARVRFEGALEHVALHEGLMLPAASPASVPSALAGPQAASPRADRAAAAAKARRAGDRTDVKPRRET
jgi:DNA-binding transcriptional MerR regulator